MEKKQVKICFKIIDQPIEETNSFNFLGVTLTQNYCLRIMLIISVKSKPNLMDYFIVQQTSFQKHP